MSPTIDAERKPLLFILCGNHTEFQYWARRINEKTMQYDVRYVHSERVVRGHRGANFIRLGNWFSTRDHTAEIVMEILRMTEGIELHYSDIFGFESEEEEREYYSNLGPPKKPQVEDLIDFISEEEMLL